MLRICLNKSSLKASTKENYRALGVLPIKLVIDIKVAIMFIFKIVIKDLNKKMYDSKK